MRRCMLTLTFLFALTACGSRSTAPNPQNASIAGTWHLQTCDGQPLPCVMQSGASTLSVTADEITVTNGGTWSHTMTVSVVINGGAPQQQVANDGGTWARSGASVVLTSPTSGITNATFTGSTLVIADTGGTAIYSRSRTSRSP